MVSVLLTSNDKPLLAPWGRPSDVHKFNYVIKLGMPQRHKLRPKPLPYINYNPPRVAAFIGEQHSIRFCSLYYM